jgi:hypothetical protein
MSRRRKTDDSSLELLLDTICNTFGGVLFLAMLVSLLLQTSRKQISESSTKTQPSRPAVSKAEVIRLSTEAADLQDEMERLEADLGRVRAFVAEFSIPGLAERLDALHAEELKQRRLESRRTSVLAALTEEKTATVTAAASANASRERSREASSAATEAAERLKAASKQQESLIKSAILLQEKIDQRNTIESTGKAPRERDTDKTEVGFLLRYGRLYPTHDHTQFSRTVNEKDFTVKQGIGMNNAVAKPGAGIEVAAPDADTEIQQLLAKHPKDGWYPCIVVHPDSFDAFQLLKAKLVSQGYEYRVIATDKPITDQGNEGRVQ